MKIIIATGLLIAELGRYNCLPCFNKQTIKVLLCNGDNYIPPLSSFELCSKYPFLVDLGLVIKVLLCNGDNYIPSLSLFGLCSSNFFL